MAAAPAKVALLLPGDGSPWLWHLNSERSSIKVTRSHHHLPLSLPLSLFPSLSPHPPSPPPSPVSALGFESRAGEAVRAQALSLKQQQAQSRRRRGLLLHGFTKGQPWLGRKRLIYDFRKNCIQSFQLLPTQLSATPLRGGLQNREANGDHNKRAQRRATGKPAPAKIWGSFFSRGLRTAGKSIKRLPFSALAPHTTIPPPPFQGTGRKRNS
ncbi:uncharacterized protein LOC117055448 isoform X2 [Lacerta agilis]|uniref:uncharacterized protein LOC117055448 isoform X2 n=1 Tax=Lacerta agilis TaxID=80427 RepID=UPI00141993F5|nr:uncharacterized protein LOC117055448 isoform X2 [Lacerta agilis]